MTSWRSAARRILNGTNERRRRRRSCHDESLHNLCKNISQVAHSSLQIHKTGRLPRLGRYFETNQLNVVAAVGFESRVFFKLQQRASASIQVRCCGDEGNVHVVLANQGPGELEKRTDMALCRKWEDYHMRN